MLICVQHRPAGSGRVAPGGFSSPLCDIPLGCCLCTGPRQSLVLPSACCVGSMRSDSCCCRCSLWCCFRISGAQHSALYMGMGTLCTAKKPLCMCMETLCQKARYAGCGGDRFKVLAAHSPSALRSSTTRLAVFTCACGPTLPPRDALEGGNPPPSTAPSLCPASHYLPNAKCRLPWYL